MREGTAVYLNNCVCMSQLVHGLKVGMIFLLQVTDMVIVLEVVEALEGIPITADDIRVSS